MIERGFLTKKIYVNEVVMSLRTLNKTDLFLIQERLNPKQSDYKVWSVAHSVWILEGQYLLEKTPYVSYDIYNQFKNIPKPYLEKIYHALLELYEKQSRCFQYLESFLYEDISRKIWLESAKGLPNKVSLTGLPGTDRLPLNPIQEIWVAYNQNEDSRVDYLAEWELTKAVMSTQNPKGVQKITDADKKKQSEQEQNRQRVHDTAYYLFIGDKGRADFLKGGGVGNVLEVNGEAIFQPKSADELAEEFRRWVTGEEDLHDKVVRNFKEEIKERADQVRAQKHRDAIKSQERKRAQEDYLSPTTKLEPADPTKIKPQTNIRKISTPNVGNPVFDRWFNASYEPPQEFKSLYKDEDKETSISNDLSNLSNRKVILDDHGGD